MIKNAIESQILERIQAFVEELGRLVRRSALEAVSGVLSAKGAGAGPRGRRRGTRHHAGGRPKRGRARRKG